MRDEHGCGVRAQAVLGRDSGVTRVRHWVADIFIDAGDAGAGRDGVAPFCEFDHCVIQ